MAGEIQNRWPEIADFQIVDFQTLAQSQASGWRDSKSVARDCGFPDYRDSKRFLEIGRLGLLGSRARARFSFCLRSNQIGGHFLYLGKGIWSRLAPHWFLGFSPTLGVSGLAQASLVTWKSSAFDLLGSAGKNQTHWLCSFFVFHDVLFFVLFINQLFA